MGRRLATPELFAVAAYVIPTVFGLGTYLTFTPKPQRIEAAAASWAIGWAALNLVAFVSNQYLSIALDETFYVLVSVPLAVLGIFQIERRWGTFRSLIRAPVLPAELRSRLGMATLVLIAGILLFVLYKSLIIYPVHPDELIYHMELPKVAWQTGFLPVHPGTDLADEATAYPDLLVTQQLWVYLGGSAFDPSLVRLIVPAYTALLTLLLFFDTRKWFGLIAAGLAVGLFLSLWSFTSLTILLMDEIPVAFYAYLAVHFAIERLETGGSWSPAGVFAGLAGLVKYDGLAVLVALGIALIINVLWKPRFAPQPTHNPGWRSLGRNATGYFGAALLPILPLYMRNLVVLGNPVYPYFFGGVNAQLSPAILALIGTPSFSLSLWSSEIVALLATVLVAGALLGLLRLRQWTSKERLLLLLVLFYLPPYLAFPLLGSQIRYIAPLLPPLAVFAGVQIEWWLMKSRPRQRLAGTGIVACLGGIAGATLAFMPFYEQFTLQVALMTFGIFVVSALIIVTVVGAGSLLQSDRTRKALAFGLVLVLLAPGVLAVADEKSEADPLNWRPNLLPQPQDAYLTPRLWPDWPVWQWMNANLPRNATVLSFDPRTFYIEARVISAMSPKILATDNLSLDQAVGVIRSYGIGYILDNAFGRGLFLNYFYVDQSPIFQNLTNAAYFRPLHTEGTTILYEVLA